MAPHSPRRLAGFGSAGAAGVRRQGLERMHRALPAPMHERMDHQDVDEDHRVEAEHPEARAAALPAPPVRVRGQREQEGQREGEDDDERGVARAEKAIQLRQKRLGLRMAFAPRVRRGSRQAISRRRGATP